MSAARSFRSVITSAIRGISVASAALIGLFLFLAPPAQANCSYSCQASFTAASPACATDANCASACSTICTGLTNPYHAVVDTSVPSTCTAGTCSPCVCAPLAQISCPADPADVLCTTSCNGVCPSFVRPSGAAIDPFTCLNSAPLHQPHCATPANGGAANSDHGICRFSCVSPYPPGTVLNNTTVHCTQATAATDCTDAALTADHGGSPICSAGNVALAASCNSSGYCVQPCRPPGATSPAAPVSQDDQSSSCSTSNTAAAATTCRSRCDAACSQSGMLCADTPVPACVAANGDASASLLARNGTGGVGGGNVSITGQTNSTNQNRTAPALRVTFPDAFGGNLTIQQIIGSVVRIMIGLCGVFFLGVFVYGGLMYLTSAGEPKKVKQGQDAIVNAVVGLVVILISYMAVNLVVQTSDALQTGSIGSSATQSAADPTALAPGGTTRASGRSSQGGSATNPGGADAAATTGAHAPEAGSAGAACASYFNADPATCADCPAGVRDISTLIEAHSGNFPAPSSDIPDPALSCRTCLQDGVTALVPRYPGLDQSCVPVLLHLWSSGCHDECDPGNRNAGRVVTGQDATAMDCAEIDYNSSETSCSQCIAYWIDPAHTDRQDTMNAVTSNCPSTALDRGKAAYWCATAESPSQLHGAHSQSGGYCTRTH